VFPATVPPVVAVDKLALFIALTGFIADAGIEKPLPTWYPAPAI
jgi:hypothetical protein